MIRIPISITRPATAQGWQHLNPPSGYTQTFPQGINNTGQVLVDAETQSGSYQVFLYDNGWTNLNAPSGFQQGLPQGINDAGEVLAATQTGTTRQAVLYDNSQVWQTNLPAPGGAMIYNGLGINKSGQVLAVASQGSGLLLSTESFLYDPTEGWTDLGTKGGPIKVAVVPEKKGAGAFRHQAEAAPVRHRPGAWSARRMSCLRQKGFASIKDSYDLNTCNLTIILARSNLLTDVAIQILEINFEALSGSKQSRSPRPQTSEDPW